MVLCVPGSRQILDAIAFNVDLQLWPDQAREQVEIAYRLDVNEFRGQRSVQLVVEQLVPV
jgi:single-stranded-DNA-specific exonuclease